MDVDVEWITAPALIQRSIENNVNQSKIRKTFPFPKAVRIEM
jgi:hypothetical protein